MISLSVIIPTFNEAGNISLLLDDICSTLAEIDFQIVVVDDDSPDGTADIVKAYSLGLPHDRIICVNRYWSKGLSSAVMVGVSIATKEYVCVMDGDGQHQAGDILDLVNHLPSQRSSLVIGSRFLGNSSHDMTNLRLFISRLGIKICAILISKKLTDPLSGFFLINRSVINEHRKKLHKKGFKLLLDILMLDRKLSVKEVSISFHERREGSSKLNMLTFFHVFGQIIENISRGIIPSEFIVFSIMGLSGVLLHLLTMNYLVDLGVVFVWANTIAILAAMISNFFLNNYITFDNVFSSWGGKIKGFCKYLLGNSLSLFANIGVASQLQSNDMTVSISALGGILAGTLLNYFVSKSFVFKS